MTWTTAKAIHAAMKDRKARGICMNGYREGEKDSTGKVHKHNKTC